MGGKGGGGRGGGRGGGGGGGGKGGGLRVCRVLGLLFQGLARVSLTAV